MVKMNFAARETLEAHRELTRLPLALKNARELGGIELRDGRHVRRGLLLRTTRLFDAPEADLRRLREDYHVALILDMRDESEIRSSPDPEIPGAKWVHVPIIDFAFMRASMAARAQAHQTELPEIRPENFSKERVLDHMLAMARSGSGDAGLGDAYASYLDGVLGREKLGLFFHELAALESGAALWHCRTGKDRTGIAAGLILDVLGADWETIAVDYETSNLFFEPEIAGMEALLRAKGVEEELIAPICGFDPRAVYRDMKKAGKGIERDRLPCFLLAGSMLYYARNCFHEGCGRIAIRSALGERGGGNRKSSCKENEIERRCGKERARGGR